MVDDNFYVLFPIFKNNEESFKNLSHRNKNISISDPANNGSLIEYNVYDLFLEYQSVLFDYYNNYLKKQYNLFNNFLIYFYEFLNEFKNYGISTHPIQSLFGDFRSSFSSDFPRDMSGEFGYLLGTNPQQTYERAFNNIRKEIDNIKSGYYNRINSDTKDLDISDPDSFANFAFGYSSFASLKNSVHLYMKTLSSGLIIDILSKLLNIINQSDIFRQIAFPLNRWPKGNYPASLSSFITPSPGFLVPKSDEISNQNMVQKDFAFSFKSLVGALKYMYWISENTATALDSIISEFSVGNQNFNLIRINVDDKTLFSVSKNLLHLNELLFKNNLSKEKIFSNEFFYEKKIENISNLFKNLIREQNEIYYPLINKIFADKTDALKAKYKKILKISDDNPNIIYLNEAFDTIYKKIKEDSIPGQNFYSIYHFLPKGSSYNVAFGDNASIINSIMSKMSIQHSHANLNYINLLKSSDSLESIENKIKAAILNADNEVNLSDIFLNVLEEIRPKFSTVIKESYIDNPVILDSINIEMIKTIKLSSKNYPKNILYNKNEQNKKKDSSYIQDFSNIFEIINSINNENFESLNIPLRISNLSSRLESIELFGYKDLMEMEKRKAEKGSDKRIDDYLESRRQYIEDQISKGKYEDLDKKVEDNRFKNLEQNKNIYKALSVLVFNNFKKEGEDIQSNSERIISTKIPEFSKELNKTTYVTREIPFSNISLIIDLLEQYPSNFNFSFSDFLKSIRSDIFKHTESLMGYDSKEHDPTPAGIGLNNLALFWIKSLSDNTETSSPESLQKNIFSFFENLPLIYSIVNANDTLKSIIKLYSKEYGSTYGNIDYKKLMSNFISQSKFSKIDTLKNLSSVLKFAHNYEEGGDNYDYGNSHDIVHILENTKILNKLYLNNYQTFLKSYIDFSTLLRDGLKGSYFRQNSLTPYDLELEVYTLKEELKQDPGFGPEKAEKLLPESRLNSIIFFQMESCKLNVEDFDKAVSLTGGNFDPKAIAILDNVIATVKQIKDIREYVQFAKPKLDKTVENNFAFSGSNNDKSEWRFRTLGDLDPQLFSIGIETNCCQRIGGPGAGAAIDSFINPYSSVITLEVNNGNNWIVVSQSYFHIVPKLKYFILDNIESGKFNNDNLKSMIGYNFFEAYAILARKLKEKGYKKVLCGKSHTVSLNVDSSKFDTTSIDSDPRHFEVKEEKIHRVYTDFNNDDCYDLLKPSFSVPEPQGMVFTASSYFRKEMLLKIANSELKKDKDNNILKLANYFAKLNQIHYSNKVLLLGNLK